ncbi:hypothetical protein BKA69DRAFT_1122933 [Paraphysoderma sedebokerense]|nr:hypothetical protein BKA69DRAFT_1122933 [Paraphysoderma sedebokerense]
MPSDGAESAEFCCREKIPSSPKRLNHQRTVNNQLSAFSVTAMKSAVSSSKDKLQKNPLQNRNSNASQKSIANINRIGPLPDGDVAQSEAVIAPAFVPWPEWIESEVQAEKWNTKHTFEDTDSAISLPKSLAALVDSYKRPVEFCTGGDQPVVLSDELGSAELDKLFEITAEVNGIAHESEGQVDVSDRQNVIQNDEAFRQQFSGSMNQPDLQANEEITSADNSVESSEAHADITVMPHQPIPSSVQSSNDKPTSQRDFCESYIMSRFFNANRHLLVSSLMREILSSYHTIYELAKSMKHTNVFDELAPWDHIYPKAKDGMPMYNSSGKYMVKLYWCGAWRKIIVDDRIPVDAEGKPLLISSPIENEIWPLILTKAILKLACVSYKSTEGNEHGDFCVFHSLMSWYPEHFPIKPAISPFLPSLSQQHSVWTTLLNLLEQNNSAGTTSRRAGSANSNQTKQQLISNSPGTPSFSRELKDRAKNAKQVTGQLSTILIAYREVEGSSEKALLGSLSFPTRILEMKESMQSDSQIVRYLRLQGFMLGRTPKCNPHRLLSEDSVALNTFETPDIWVTLKDFTKIFKCVRIFHNPVGFKCVKSITQNCSADKVGEMMTKVLPVLYLADSSKPADLLITFSTHEKLTQPSYQNPSVIIEEYDWKSSYNVSTKPALRIATTGVKGSWFRCDPGKKAYKFIVDASPCYSVQIASTTEFMLEEETKYLSDRFGSSGSIHVKEFEDQLSPQPPGSWNILFKYTFQFQEPVFLSAQLFIPEAINLYTNLRMIDNDKNADTTESMISMLIPGVYSPNKVSSVPLWFSSQDDNFIDSVLEFRLGYVLHDQNGYTLLAESKAPFQRNPGKWKLRLISEPYPVLPNIVTVVKDIPPPEPNTGVAVGPKFFVQDFEESYVPNKSNVMFRYAIKVPTTIPEAQLSIQLSFSVPGVVLVLTVLDYEVEVVKVKAKSIVTIPNVTLFKNDDPAKKTTNSDTNVTTHKYILQGTLEPNDKYNPIPISTESTRTRTGAGSKSASTSKRRHPTVKSDGISTPSTPTGSLTPNLGSSGVQPSNIESTWKLRLIYPEGIGVVITKDTEKEDRYRIMKESWESAKPGRAAQARETRESWLREHKPGVSLLQHLTPPYGTSNAISVPVSNKHDPAKPSSTTIVPRVLTPDELADRENKRLLVLSEFEKWYENLKSSRASDKLFRTSYKQLLLQRFSEAEKELNEWRELDAKRREEYRRKVLKEMEDEAANRAAKQKEEMEREMMLLEAEKLEETVAKKEEKKKKK